MPVSLNIESFSPPVILVLEYRRDADLVNFRRFHHFLKHFITYVERDDGREERNKYTSEHNRLPHAYTLVAIQFTLNKTQMICLCFDEVFDSFHLTVRFTFYFLTFFSMTVYDHNLEIDS